MKREDIVKPENFNLQFFKDEKFKRQRCIKCNHYFWSLTERKTCGEPPCGEFTFIGKPSIPKKYDWKEMRQTFIEFFENNDHTSINRYPTVARWKPDTFYVGASIYCFQPWVLNKTVEPPANPLVMSQPSLRFADLDNVGLGTGRHCSIFEMMAHHAFNNHKIVYWKEETTDYCFRWLTEELKMKPEKVVFKESLWEGGGNAGPCFEVIADGNEVATLVFMEYETKDGNYVPMDMKVVDTGYGLERHVWASNGLKTIYDGIYSYVIDWLKKKAEKDDKETMHRIYQIADHGRSIMFILGDGVVPSNAQEGYIARLMIRRTLRNLEDLEITVPLEEVVERHIKEHKDIYPEFEENKDDILKMIEVETRKYKETLKNGEALVKKIISDKRKVDEKTLMMLYDSHGLLPRDVKKFVPEIKVDLSDIDTKIAVQKEMAKLPQEKKIIETKGLPETKKLYYESEKLFETKAGVLKIEGEHVVLDQTIFYPRGGGQEPDHGFIDNSKVYDVDIVNNLVVHKVENPKFKVGQTVSCKVDPKRRKQIVRHHTATHILTGTCRKILGNHVWQAGTKKDENKAHLDITHYESLTEEKLKEIENFANEMIRKRLDVKKLILPRNIAEREYGFRIYQGGAIPAKDLMIKALDSFDVEACGGLHVDNLKDVEEIFIFNTKKMQDGIVRLEYVAGKELVEKTKKELEKMRKEEKDRLEKKLGEIETEKKKIKELKESGKILFGVNYVDTDAMKELEAIGLNSVKKNPTKYSVLIGNGIVFGIRGERCKDKIENIVKEAARIMGGSAGGSANEFKGGGPLKEKGKEAFKKLT